MMQKTKKVAKHYLHKSYDYVYLNNKLQIYMLKLRLELVSSHGRFIYLPENHDASIKSVVFKVKGTIQLIRTLS